MKPLLQQLDQILVPWDSGWSHTVYSSAGSLPEPPLQPGSCDEVSVVEGPLGCQEPILAPTIIQQLREPGPVPALPALGVLPHPGGQPSQGTACPQQLQHFPGGGPAWVAGGMPLHPRTPLGATHHCHQWEQIWAMGHAWHAQPVSSVLVGRALPVPLSPLLTWLSSPCSPEFPPYSTQGGGRQCKTLMSSQCPLS